MPHDCFADEIAIDFPSVEPAVERMRDAFLGDHAAEVADGVHRTELRVTRREASNGLTVPVEVPVRALCPACGGRGETWTECCGTCAGTGGPLVHRSVRVSLPPGLRSGDRIRFRVSSPGAGAVRVELRIAVASAA
jgi:hypothetical protein